MSKPAAESSPEPVQVEAWRIYENLTKLALKRGVFDEFEEVEVVRSIIPDIKDGNIDDKTKNICKALFDKMLARAALVNMEEASTAINLYNAICKFDPATNATQPEQPQKSSTSVSTPAPVPVLTPEDPPDNVQHDDNIICKE